MQIELRQANQVIQINTQSIVQVLTHQLLEIHRKIRFHQFRQLVNRIHHQIMHLEQHHQQLAYRQHRRR